jgi:uncharacterized protein YndB with AHSA1/START domain
VTVGLLLISDGRDDYLRTSLRSLRRELPPFDVCVHIDDRDHKLGFGGAIQEGWRQLLETDAQYVWHAEGDFTYNRPISFEHMRAVLDAHPHLVQLALRRQPWNPQEKAAGGQVEIDPGGYTDRSWAGHQWLEHTKNFTTNPSLYPRWVMDEGWPDGDQSEGRFGGELLKRRPELRFAYWGSRASGEWCHHIGYLRKGRGY